MSNPFDMIARFSDDEADDYTEQKRFNRDEDGDNSEQEENNPSMDENQIDTYEEGDDDTRDYVSDEEDDNLPLPSETPEERAAQQSRLRLGLLSAIQSAVALVKYIAEFSANKAINVKGGDRVFRELKAEDHQTTKHLWGQEKPEWVYCKEHNMIAPYVLVDTASVSSSPQTRMYQVASCGVCMGRGRTALQQAEMVAALMFNNPNIPLNSQSLRLHWKQRHNKREREKKLGVESKCLDVAVQAEGVAWLLYRVDVFVTGAETREYMTQNALTINKQTDAFANANQFTEMIADFMLKYKDPPNFGRPPQMLCPVHKIMCPAYPAYPRTYYNQQCFHCPVKRNLKGKGKAAAEWFKVDGEDGYASERVVFKAARSTNKKASMKDVDA